MLHNPTIEIEIAWDESENAYVAADVEDEIHDICADADTDATVEDTGIGSYEYWGSRGVDTCIEVTEVTGDVTIDVSYSVTLSDADQARADAEEADESDLQEAAIAQAMTDYAWPGASTSGSVEGRRHDYDYDVSWSTNASGHVTQVTYEASLG
jgi:hypothetical protein